MPNLSRFTAFARKVGAPVPDPEPTMREEDWQVLYDERAAILEYDCGLARAEAERQAKTEIDAKRKLAS